MADWNFKSVVEYERNGNSLNFKETGFHIDNDGTISDGNPNDDTFTVGETLSFGPFSGPYAGNFVDGDGNINIVIYDGLNNNLAYFFSPVDLQEALDILPRVVKISELDTAPLEVCFAPGTLIATPDGERAVEVLRVGDIVLTADGREVPVRWIGRQTVLKRFGPAERRRPVCLRAGSLGPDLPHTDLTVTADHAILLDGVLCNASALVNGDSVTRIPHGDLPERMTYYHVETEAHDVILANGVPAETFVDLVSRQAFDNYDEFLELYGVADTVPEMAYPRALSARQLPASIRTRLGLTRAA